MTIRIVTDSTSDVPADLAARYGIVVVPAYVNVGDQSFLEGVDITPAEFYRQLPHYSSHPSTAAPSAGIFAETYERVIAEGATAVISIHIAASLSAMYNSARLGAESVTEATGVPIHMVDSGAISLGSGWLGVVAGQAAAAGESAGDVLARIQASLPRIRTFAALDTLEFLHKGGRVSWAQFGIGTVLQIKPLLRVGDGVVEVHERIRTRKRCIQRLRELVDELAPFERLAVLHASALAEAEALQEDLQPYFPDGQPQFITEVTPAIGVHVGPGALGFSGVVAPR